MPLPPDESRLEKSKMSFGEHLEELRKALFKSIAALFVGFLVGLYFANDIVDYVQTPVRDALTSFYMNQAVEQQREHIAELKAAGKPVPEQVITAEDLAREGLMLTEYLVAPQDLAALVRDQFPQLPAAPDVKPEAERAEAVPAEGSEEQQAAAGRDIGSPEDGATIDKPAEAKTADAKSVLGFSRSALMRLRVYQPIDQDPRVRLVGHSNTEVFGVVIRAALISGLVFASPFIFYFIWEFVAAGLYRHEQTYVFTYLPIALSLFIGGALLAFFFAFEPLLDFMFWYYDRTDTQPDLRLSEWISFVLLMPLGFGVSFQLPLIMLLLERIGVFTIETYWSKWRAAVVVIAILAMLLTPSADPYSMLLMGVPLVLLYFGGIWLCQYMPRSRSRELSPV
jgi:sec-independent protein translocase protein TatC